ncbi:type II secretion system F family protein [Leifsonia kafniensis]|uniref:Type II secretion system F family protein n=1 Tax=Leifsonia kafniensis TaxID=475957 RepID=A0ABP7KBC9_9MICO
MSLLLGLLLGAGMLLTAAPFLWPAGAASLAGTAVSAGMGAPSVTEPTLGERARDRLAQAGFSRVTPGAFIVVSLLLGIAIAALAEATLGVRALSFTAGFGAVLLPAVIVSRRARARRRANRTVWPDVVDHLISGVRSGLALPDSVSSLAHSGPPATREAFAGFEREYRATGNFAHCIDQLKGALADPIADRILETLRMAREVGGSDLTLVLRSLASWLRQDAAIRLEVESRQSWILNAARLGAAAPWIILILLITRPEAALAYNTPTGMAVILGGLVVSVLAYRIMIAFGRLPEERRWFR